MARSLIVVLLLLTFSCFGQSDLELLRNTDLSDSTALVKRKAAYVFKDKHWLVKYNPVSLLFGGALYVYQGVISPQIVQGCAFEPSCSAFSKQCMHTFGVVKGIALSTDRLTRCTRLSSIDFHPVLFGDNGKVRDVPEFYRLRKARK